MKPALLTFDPGGSTNPGAPSRFATLPASSSVLMTLVVLGIGASAMRALPGPMPADVLLVSTAPVFKAPFDGDHIRAI